MARNLQCPPCGAFGLLAVALLLFLALASSSEAYTINYWVANNGSDQNSGDAESPFQTILHARDVVRASGLRGIVTINVYIKGGVYRLTAPLGLTAADSGASGAEVVYQAAPGENVTISGGRQVSGWSLHDRALNIWRAQVDAGVMPRQLYVNGRRATRARTPDYPNYYTPKSYGYQYEYIIGDDPRIPPAWGDPPM